MVKSQGLPLNFIIIAVLGILVAIVAIMFFTSGFRTEAVDRQKAINECSSRCLVEVQWAATGGTFPRENSKFCSYKADVKGMGENITCPDLVNCHINDFGCDLSCDGTTAKCGTTSNTGDNGNNNNQGVCSCDNGKCNNYCSNVAHWCTRDRDCKA